MMKHYISGKEKPEEEQDKICDTCKNGEIWKNEKPIMEDELSPTTKDYICGVCLSKYYKDRKPYILPLYEYVSREFKEVEKKMDKDKLEFHRTIFEDTKKCPEHMWITSKPFKTAEGKFQITNCLVCKLARINYDGHIYENSLMKLLGWISHKGIEYEKKIKQKEASLKTLAQVTYGKDVEFNKMFSFDDEPEFSFDEKPEFSFDEL